MGIENVSQLLAKKAKKEKQIMLQKPGAGGSGGHAKPYSSSRRSKQVVESPDDIVKRLSRLPANKKCCDCGGRLPNSVNLSIGCFLCLTCAGIHRELPSGLCRIKGVGHTVFTQDEADFLTATDNDQINGLYLAHYSAATERLRQPTDNADPHVLRAWIFRKYKDQAWREHSGTANGTASSSTVEPTTTAATHSATTTSGGGGHHNHHNATAAVGRGVAGNMRQATVVSHIPPKTNNMVAPAAVVDLFDSSAGTTAPPGHHHHGWDAFGPPPPQNDPAAFPADFGSLQTQQQQQQAPNPTLANSGGNAPPQQTPPGGGLANFQPPQNFANFHAPQNHTAGNVLQQQQPQSDPGNFANFPSPTPPSQPQSGGSLANFPGPPQSNFAAAFPAPPPQGYPSQTQQQQQPLQEDFANFASFPPPQQPNGPPQSAQPQQQHGGFANFPLQGGVQQLPPGQQGGFGNFPLPGGVQPAGFGNTTSQAGGVQQRPPSMQSQAGGVQQQPPSMQQQITVGNTQLSAPQPPTSLQMGQQAGSGSGNQQQATQETPDKFDAFNSLRILKSDQAPATNSNSVGGENLGSKHPSPDAMLNVSASSEAQKKIASTEARKSKYACGQKVYYKSASYVGSAKIVKVHFDDHLEPFYTIDVQGKEKQTDDAHLDEFSPLQTEIQKMLSDLSDDQLEQVKHYISQLPRGTVAPTAPLSVSVPAPGQPPSATLKTAPHPQQTLSYGSNPSPTVNGSQQQQQHIGGFGENPQRANFHSPTQGGVAHSPQANQAPSLQQQTGMPPSQQQPPDVQQPGANQGVPGPAQPMPHPPQMGQSFGMMPSQGMAQSGVMQPPQGGMMMGGGGDYNGIPSPAVDSKAGVPNNGGLPAPPLVQGPHQTQTNQMQTPQGHVQFQPQVQHMQAPQGRQFQPQMQQMQSPQGHQFQPHMPQNQTPQGQHQMQFQPQQGQQAQVHTQQGLPPQMQFSHQPQQISNQQYPQAQEPPKSPLSPKGNPFDFY